MTSDDGDVKLNAGEGSNEPVVTEPTGDETPRSSSRAASTADFASRETTPPPLPPRPKNRALSRRGSLTSIRSFRPGTSAGRPQLQGKATIALSLEDVNAISHGASASRPPGPRHAGGATHERHFSKSNSEFDDSTSVQSNVPVLEAGMDMESILGEVLPDRTAAAWEAGNVEGDVEKRSAMPIFDDDEHFEREFAHEFDELEAVKDDGSNEAMVLREWKAKLKHFLILSSAGKPIWSRHGDDNLTLNNIGVIQTIISFYQDAKDTLRGFTAGEVRFVIMSKGPLNLVAISRLGESDAQLRTQLESLYMQILSTLTLPSMERMFRTRASTDLRRPLQGTETLLSALADGFTRGSPSTLLSALECLKMRKSHRQVVNNTFLKIRRPNLLYGLIVAGGRLVSVVRPKKHSLHPGDLHLIFNMLFEAGSVKAGGGENWIPLCLPGFNNTGYLYMYVSFVNLDKVSEEVTERPSTSEGAGDEVAVLLISADRESFYEMREMRNDLVQQLDKNGSINIIKAAVKQGRLPCTSITTGSAVQHFLYKSRGNVQFIMPSYEPHFDTLVARRR